MLAQIYFYSALNRAQSRVLWLIFNLFVFIYFSEIIVCQSQMDFDVIIPQFPQYLIWTFLHLLVSIRIWLLEESKMATTFSTATVGLSCLVLLQTCAVISTVNHVSCISGRIIFYPCMSWWKTQWSGLKAPLWPAANAQHKWKSSIIKLLLFVLRRQECLCQCTQVDKLITSSSKGERMKKSPSLTCVKLF